MSNSETIINSEFDPLIFATSYLNYEDSQGIEELEEPIGQALTTFYQSVCKLPYPDDAKIIAAFTLLPSIMCKVVPILFLKGAAGSGKSQILVGMERLTDSQMFAGSSTAASVKNHINYIRFADPDTLRHERNCHLIMENVNADTFNNSDILGCFLNGYNRATDRQFISGGKGVNIVFKTFTAKAISSVWDFESAELMRRCLVIRTKKSDDLENISIDLPSTKLLRTTIKNLWGDATGCTEFVAIRQSLKWVKSYPISKEHLNLCADLIAAGVVGEVWESPIDAMSDLATLFSRQKNRKTLLETIVLEALESLTSLKQDDWAKLPKDIQIAVNPKALKRATDAAVDDGLISRPSLDSVKAIIGSVGFMPATTPKGIVYVYRK